MDLQHPHHLGACQKCRISGPPQTYQIRVCILTSPKTMIYSPCSGGRALLTIPVSIIPSVRVEPCGDMVLLYPVPTLILRTESLPSISNKKLGC